MRKIRYKLPKGVELDILDNQVVRKNRQDSAFYTWGGTSHLIARIIYKDRDYGISCLGEMRIHYKNEFICYTDELILAGIKKDKDLDKIEKSGGEWINNSWFEAFDLDTGEGFLDVFHTPKEAIQSVIEQVVLNGEEVQCLYCGQVIYDLHAISGRKIDPHWATKNQDFGCEYSPESNEEAVGEHKADYEGKE
jgi:hypothetical protein